MNITVEQVVEMLETSPMSLEEIVNSLYLDDDTIVHCIDNNTDYPRDEANHLIDYMNNRIYN